MPTDKPTKDKILTDFRLMKDYETSTAGFYNRVCSDPQVTQQQVKDTFKKIVEDELRHANLVQKIIDIVNTAL
jgi:rubrerythrin